MKFTTKMPIKAEKRWLVRLQNSHAQTVESKTCQKPERLFLWKVTLGLWELWVSLDVPNCHVLFEERIRDS